MTELKIYPFWNGPYSNWYESPFVIAMDKNTTEQHYVHFNCVEQYMMYSKAMLFDDYDTAEKILATKDPREQKKLGREVKNFDPTEWYLHCENIMMRGLKEKFNSSLFFNNALKESAGKICVEASPYDKIWGVGMRENDKDITDMTKWKGQNLLGWMITKLRMEMFGA